MTEIDFYYLTPFLITAIAPVIIMITIAWVRNFNIIYVFSVAAFLLALLSLIIIPTTNLSELHPIPYRISSLIIIDGYTVIISIITLVAALIVTGLSRRYLLYQESEKEEYFVILFVAVLGSLLLIAADNFITLFLGLETLSISLYVLVSYRRSRHKSIEAGVKYLVLASVSSAFLLFGMGLIYVQVGSLEFSEIAAVGAGNSLFFITGFVMMMAGFGFKLALVPFHMWTPDVYEGSPVPIASFISTVSKGSVIAVLLRFFYAINGFTNVNFVFIISVLAIVSMFLGNLLAIRQQNIKRLLAYSSISNMGYLLITMLVGGAQGLSSAIFYILSYFITILGAFGVITLLSSNNFEADNLEDYKGLFWKQPLIAIILTITMLSLAGIPLTSGFMGKFYLAYSGINSGLWILIICLIVNSVIGLYYYLKVVTTMFSPSGETQLPASVSFSGSMVLVMIGSGILWIGLFPQWIIHHIISVL